MRPAALYVRTRANETNNVVRHFRSVVGETAVQSQSEECLSEMYHRLPFDVGSQSAAFYIYRLHGARANRNDGTSKGGGLLGFRRTQHSEYTEGNDEKHEEASHRGLRRRLKE